MKQETTEYTNVNLMNYHCGRAVAHRQFKYCVTRHLMHKSNTLLAYKFFMLLPSSQYFLSHFKSNIVCVYIMWRFMFRMNMEIFPIFFIDSAFNEEKKVELEWKRAYDKSINHSSELAAMVESFIPEVRVRMS